MNRYKTLLWRCIVAFALTTPFAQAATLQINPISTQVDKGKTFSVSINISGLRSTQALGGYDISLGYNTDLLQFKSATFGDPKLGDQLDLSGKGLNSPLVTADSSSINLIEFSLDDSADLLAKQADDFTLATLYFTALTTGTSPLALSLNSLSDSEANPLLASSNNGSVTINAPVNAVPLPAAIWLFAPALTLLMRKRSNRSNS
ncbi:MAG: cohesin domain-containing protein [Methyloglobulus sp.]|nr:hypothetical protein [Methyloglobulus sp.]